MSRSVSITVGVLLSLLVARDAAAQWNAARYDTPESRVYTTFGMDPALVGSLGYGRVVPVLGHGVQLSGEVGVVTARLDTRDFRARVGAQTSVARWRSLRLTGSARGIARGTENDLYRAFNFGADITGTLGVYRPGWFAAGELGKDKAVITHLTHGDYYRTNFYPDARDGWYLDAGGTFHYGISAGVTLGRAELVGRFGWARTEDFEDLMVPIYGSIGIGYGL